MNRIEHIIWDWNGTILDDAGLCVEITNSMLAKRNKTLMTKKFYSDIFDFPIEDYYLKVGFDYSIEPFNDLSIEFMDMYEKRKYDCKLNSHFLELQNYIKSNNISQSILSAYADDYLRDILKHYDLLNVFDYVSGLKHILADSKIENGKRLIEKLNVSKEKCLFIGDTIHDIEASMKRVKIRAFTENVSKATLVAIYENPQQNIVIKIQKYTIKVRCRLVSFIFFTKL